MVACPIEAHYVGVAKQDIFLRGGWRGVFKREENIRNMKKKKKNNAII